MIDDPTRLRHMRDAIDQAADFTRDGREAFFTDAKTQFAVVRALEVIGEAVKGVSGALCSTHPEVPWRQIASMRDRLIHGYFTVDLNIVWSVVERELAPFRAMIESLLNELAVASDPPPSDVDP